MLIIVLAVIWGHSCMPPHISGEESLWVMKFIRPVLAAVVGDDNVTVFLVRKLGHFTEYLVLGAVLFIDLMLKPDGPGINSETGIKPDHSKKKVFGRAMLLAFTAAFIDETIQIFSGRGPAIADVWIDIAGAASGAGIACFLYMLRHHNEKNPK